MGFEPWMSEMTDQEEKVSLNFSWTHISILILMGAGITVNGAAIIYLFKKKSDKMFLKLLVNTFNYSMTKITLYKDSQTQTHNTQSQAKLRMKKRIVS